MARCFSEANNLKQLVIFQIFQKFWRSRDIFFMIREVIDNMDALYLFCIPN